MILSGAVTQTCNLCRGITGGTLDSKKNLKKKKNRVQSLDSQKRKRKRKKT